MVEINKVWTTEDRIWVERSDGSQAYELFEDYPRLRYATPEERNAYELTPMGLYWAQLDEDLSFEGFFKKAKYTKLYQFFMQHPELNASAIARRLGISQMLFAQYISGEQEPSAECQKRIYDEIGKIGVELSNL